MQNRRTFLELAVASLLPAGLSAQTPAARPAGELARHALTGPFEGYEAVLVQIPLQPNVTSPAHRHSGFVLGYIQEGQMRFAINNEKEQTIPTGSTFFEPQGALHSIAGSAIPDTPGRILAFSVVPKGSPFTARG